MSAERSPVEAKTARAAPRLAAPQGEPSSARRFELLDLRTAWLLGGLFLLVTIVVNLGLLTWLDQWAVDHVMPALRPRSTAGSVTHAMFPIFHTRRGMDLPVSAAVYGVAFVASAVPALVLTAAGCVYLERQGQRRLLFGIAVAFVAVTLIELASKSLLDRPALYGTDPNGVRVRVLPFDSSFPSGHAARAVLLGVLVVVCAPRLRMLAVAWLASVLVLLVLGGWHTPSDVLGAVLLAGAFAIPVLREHRRTRPGASSRRGPVRA